MIYQIKITDQANQEIGSRGVPESCYHAGRQLFGILYSGSRYTNSAYHPDFLWQTGY